MYVTHFRFVFAYASSHASFNSVVFPSSIECCMAAHMNHCMCSGGGAMSKPLQNTWQTTHCSRQSSLYSLVYHHRLWTTVFFFLPCSPLPCDAFYILLFLSHSPLYRDFWRKKKTRSEFVVCTESKQMHSTLPLPLRIKWIHTEYRIPGCINIFAGVNVTSAQELTWAWDTLWRLAIFRSHRRSILREHNFFFPETNVCDVSMRIRIVRITVIALEITVCLTIPYFTLNRKKWNQFPERLYLLPTSTISNVYQCRLHISRLFQCVCDGARGLYYVFIHLLNRWIFICGTYESN